MSPDERTHLSMSVHRGEIEELKPEHVEDLFFQIVHFSGLSAPEIARRLDIDRRTLNRYQNHQSQPNLQRALQLLNLLGWDVRMTRKDNA